MKQPNTQTCCSLAARIVAVNEVRCEPGECKDPNASKVIQEYMVADGIKCCAETEKDESGRVQSQLHGGGCW